MARRIRPHRHHHRSPLPPPTIPLHPTIPPRRLHSPKHPHRRQRRRQRKRLFGLDRRAETAGTLAGGVHGQGCRGACVQLFGGIRGGGGYCLVGLFPSPPFLVHFRYLFFFPVRDPHLWSYRYGAGEVGKREPIPPGKVAANDGSGVGEPEDEK